jgi:hypothetical protein
MAHDFSWVAFTVAFVSALILSVGSYGAEQELDRERVSAVAAMLEQHPAGPGRPISDRDAWESLAELPALKGLVSRAESLLSQPLPEQPDELYLEFSRTGNRTRWQNVAASRRSRLTTLVLAECVENKGRFLNATRELVEALCAERTWVMPAHDQNLDNFEGRRVDIDLASSALAWNMALTNYLLGERLDTETRETIRKNVSRRVLEPYRDMFTGAREPNWWLTCTNNWNAVCLAGVTGAALAQLESRDERAEFIVAAEKYSRYFLQGFTPDGYCSEGLGYWNYGFGHYLLLAETIRQATRGGVDLLERPGVTAPATFGARIQIMSGISPAFADCSVTARPDPATMYFVNRRFGLGLKAYDNLDLAHALGDLFTAMLFCFPNAASQAAPPAKVAAAELRSWFENAGVLVARPAPGSACRLGIAAKGGHNAEHHNHNDVGSYVVVVGSRPVLLDPGKETYTARTFSSHRYDSKLLNSYGHPVPVVDGKLQRTGSQAKGEVLEVHFADQCDSLRLDLRSAYDVPELKTLQRTFVYSREGIGSFTVTDTVEFTQPRSFETALITQGEWERVDGGALIIRDADEAVRVDLSVQGAEFTVESEQIHEDAPVHPTRLAIRLKQPVTAARVTATITPIEGRASNK